MDEQILDSPENKHKEPSTAPYAMRYGLILAGSLVVFNLLLVITESHTNNMLGMLAYVLMAVVMVIGMNVFKKENQGFMKLGQGIGLGTLMSVIANGLSAVFIGIYYNWIDPDAVEQLLDNLRYESEKNPQLNDEMIDMMVNSTATMFEFHWFVLAGLAGGAIAGFFIALIISAILKKNKPTSF